MNPFLILVQVLSVALLAWGAYLCLAKRERRVRERRRFARGGRAGRRRGDLSEAQAAAREHAAATTVVESKEMDPALSLRAAGK